MLGKEVPVVRVNLILLMDAKMEEPILKVQGWVNVCIVIAVEISYSHIIHEAFLLSPLQDRDPDWEQGLGLGLVQ